MDERLAKGLRQAHGDRSQAFAPVRQRECELMRQWRRDPANAIRELAEVSRGKNAIFEQIEQKGVYVRPHGLHSVKRERVAIALICMQYAHRWIAAVCEQRKPRLRFQACTEVVPHGVNRRGRRARCAGQHRSARVGSQPARRYACKVALAEPNPHVAPRAEIESRGRGLDHTHAFDRFGGVYRGSQLAVFA